MVDSKYWQRVQDIFDQAKDLPVFEQRSFVENASDGDENLLKEVLDLLRVDHSGKNESLQHLVSANAKKVILDNNQWIGQQLGPWKIESHIADGGMGAVYAATRADNEYTQKVAIKIIHGHANQETIERFQRERQILAQLKHPNIAQLIDGGTTDKGVPYLVMEYVQGETILDYCLAKKLSVNEKINLFLQVSSAIKYAHQNLIIHRDIKEGNVMVTEDGTVKVLDFGIAKILEPETNDEDLLQTRKDMRLLTPGNATPEQILGEPVSTRTDVYTLGGLLYELLTLQPVFDLANRNTVEMQNIICKEQPTRPSTAALKQQENDIDTDLRQRISQQLKGDLDTILLKALQKDQERRYQSVDLFEEDLNRFLKHYPIQARRDSFLYLTGKFIQRHTATSIVAAVALLSTIGFISFIMLQSAQLKQEREIAVHESAVAKQVSQFLVDMFSAADPNINSGDIPNAVELLDQASASIDELDASPELRAELLMTLGQVYLRFAQYEKASSFIIEALEIRQSIANISPRDLGLAHVYYGESLYLLARYEEAREQGELGLSLIEQTENNVDDIIYAKYMLANIYDSLNDIEMTLQIDEEVLALSLATYGEMSSDTAQALSSLGHGLRAAGRYEEAAENLSRALEINRQIHGDMNLDTAHSLNQLAQTNSYLGNYETALTLAQEGLNIRRTILGVHPEVAASLGSTATALMNVGREDEAIASKIESLNVLQEIYGNQHDYVAGTLNSLGNMYLQVSNEEDAISAFEQSLDIMEELVEPDHPNLAYPLTSLGRINLQQNQLVEANNFLTRAFELRNNALPENHWLIGQTSELLGQTLAEQGLPEQAITYLELALNCYAATYGDNDERTVAVQEMLNAIN